MFYELYVQDSKNKNKYYTDSALNNQENHNTYTSLMNFKVDDYEEYCDKNIKTIIKKKGFKIIERVVCKHKDSSEWNTYKINGRSIVMKNPEFSIKKYMQKYKYHIIKASINEKYNEGIQKLTQKEVESIL